MKTKTQLVTKLKAAIRPKIKLTVSEWAERNFYLPKTSAEPGKFKIARTPYVREIMDSFSDSTTRRVVVKSAAQMGKTTVLLAVIGYYIEVNPCTMMLLQPTLEMAQDFSKDRLNRMIQDCGSLTPLFGDLEKTRNANQTILSKFFPGGRIVLQGANSPAGLASRPIKILLCDETDRFPVSAGDEGDPINLAGKRTTTFWDYKIGLFSTPTVEGISRIDKEYLLGTQERWSHACPNCGEYHFLQLAQMVTDYTERVDEYKNRVVFVNSVKWKCPDCGYEFTQTQLKNAPQRFIAQNPAALKNGVRSFHINGFSSSWLKWETLLQEYFESQGDAVRESVIYNTRFGESYALKGEYQSETEFLERREEYGDEIPIGVKILTAAVDVQANRLEYLICGWSVGEECYCVERGQIVGEPNAAATWRELDAVLDRAYSCGGGNMKIARTFIDSGYSTKNVYDYCLANQQRGRFAIKGLGTPGAALLHSTTYPQNSGVILSVIGVNDGKSEIYSRLAITGAGERAIHFGLDDQYLIRRFDAPFFKQLIAERRVVKSRGGILYTAFEKIAAKERNEALDLMVYNLACIKSIIGNDKNFWQRFGVSAAVAPVKKNTIAQASKIVDIW